MLVRLADVFSSDSFGSMLIAMSALRLPPREIDLSDPIDVEVAAERNAPRFKREREEEYVFRARQYATNALETRQIGIERHHRSCDRGCRFGGAVGME